MEPGERHYERPPRHPQENIFAGGLGLHCLWVGLLMGVVSLLVQSFIHPQRNQPLADHGFYCSLSGTTRACSGHTLRQGVPFQSGTVNQQTLLGALILTFGLQMSTIYVPFLNPIFKTEPLTFEELAITLALSTGIFWAVELEKLLKRRTT